MGRRTLRRIDPNLDYSRWIIAEASLPSTINSVELFAREAPLEIEVGSGKGLFLTRATEAHPDRNFVGIEIAGKYARYAAARLAKVARRNGRLIHGDATRIFHERIADNSLSAVHVYFPDPWWKKRHRKRRVMNPDFVQHIQRALEPQGWLHFWTDVQEYYEATLELLKAETTLQGPVVPSEQPADHDLDYHTHFERRMRLHDEPVYRAAYVKNSGPAQP